MERTELDFAAILTPATTMVLFYSAGILTSVVTGWRVKRRLSRSLQLANLSWNVGIPIKKPSSVCSTRTFLIVSG